MVCTRPEPDGQAFVVAVDNLAFYKSDTYVNLNMNILAKIFGGKKPGASAGKTWPFLSPENEATFTVGKIVNGEKPILLVQHDDEDGGWQFLTGEPFDMSDAKIVGLGEIAKLDPSILELADLPIGWSASRQTLTGSWRRERADLRA